MATFYNQATLRVGNVTVASNIVTGEIVEELSMTKTPVNDTYQACTVVTYAVSIVNSGNRPYNGLTLTDDLGAYTLTCGTTVVPLTYVDGSILYYEDGELQSPPDVTDTEPLTVTGISVPANGNVMLLYQATVNEYAPLGAGDTIKNTVTLSGRCLNEELTACAVITAECMPLLSISKAISPSTITERGEVTYTFEIENRGNTDVPGDATLSDLFNPILSDLTVTFNGTPWTQGEEYEYAQETGLFTTNEGALVIPAAEMTQDPDTGMRSVTPGTATLVITGNI